MAKPRRGAASGGQPQTKVAKKASEEKPQRPANKWMNCGVCAYVRGKYYPRGTSQKDLGDKINSSEEEASRHARLRKDRASGENKCQETEAVNVKHTSQVETKGYTDAFVDGYFVELNTFAKDRNLLNFADQDELVHYIKHAMGYNCGEGKTGEFGVFVTELPRVGPFVFTEFVFGALRYASHSESHEARQMKTLWSKKYRPRDFENLLTRLAAKASKVASVMGETESAEISEQLYMSSVQLEDERMCLDALRNEPHTIVRKVPKRLYYIFKKLPDNITANIMSTTSYKLASYPAPEVQATALDVAKFDSREGVLSVAMLGNSSTEFVASCQRNMVQAFIDRVVRKNSQTDFTSVVKHCGDTTGTCSDLAALDTTSETIDETIGWNPSCFVDLIALRFFGAAAEIDARERLPRELRVVGDQLYTHREKLSNRLRCHIRVGTGTANWAKTGWDRISVGDGGPDLCCLAADVLDKEDEWTDGLWGVLGTAAADDQFRDMLDKFPKYIDSIDDTDGSITDDTKNAISVKDMLVKAVCTAADVVGSHFDYFSADFRAIYHEGYGGDDDVDPIKVLYFVAHAVLNFEIGLAERSTIKETLTRCEIALKVNQIKSRTDNNPEKTTLALSDVWQTESAMKVAPQLAKASVAMPFQKFNGKVSSFTVGHPIIQGCSLATPQYMQTVLDICGAPPPEIKPLISSAQHYHLMKKTVDTVVSGNVVGCIQLAAALKAHGSMQEPVLSKPEVKEWATRLIETRGTLFESTVAAFETSEVQKFMDKYGAKGETILELIKCWSFDSSGGWLGASTRDASRERDMQIAQDFVLSFSSVERAVRELASSRASLTWLSDNQRLKLDQCAEELKDVKVLHQKCGIMLGSIILTNSTLTGIGKDASRRYVFDKLQVRQQDLPRKLVEMMASPKAEVPEHPAAASASASGLPAALEPAAAPATEEAAEAPAAKAPKLKAPRKAKAAAAAAKED
ncbi:unnamed protein product [Prorocentrum cordatum]|uniref:Uncharacterized protein n=1 Tax=Prorocentrum cordatum TaxID=2364126 RepID=A0ABN9VMU2_9DINO|nr:unnamed protein product [Polarella glacialis]